jgi:hypothetical protein
VEGLGMEGCVCEGVFGWRCSGCSRGVQVGGVLIHAHVWLDGVNAGARVVAHRRHHWHACPYGWHTGWGYPVWLCGMTASVVEFRHVPLCTNVHFACVTCAW